MTRELELADDLRAQEAHNVENSDTDTRNDLLGHRGARRRSHAARGSPPFCRRARDTRLQSGRCGLRRSRSHRIDRLPWRQMMGYVFFQAFRRTAIDDFARRLPAMVPHRHCHRDSSPRRVVRARRWASAMYFFNSGDHVLGRGVADLLAACITGSHARMAMAGPTCEASRHRQQLLQAGPLDLDARKFPRDPSRFSRSSAAGRRNSPSCRLTAHSNPSNGVDCFPPNPRVVRARVVDVNHEEPPAPTRATSIARMPHGKYSVVAARLHQRIPDGESVLGIHPDLVTEIARVSGPRDAHRDVADARVHQAKILELVERLGACSD